MEIEFSNTRRGKDLLIHDGFSYYHKRTLKTGMFVWQCSRMSYCNAKIYTSREKTITKQRAEHCHERDDERIHKQRLAEACKQRAVSVAEKPMDVISSAIAADSLSQMTRTDLKNYRQIIYRKRVKHRGMTPQASRPHTKAENSWQAVKKAGGLLERLQKGVVIGDGGFVFSLEKRGYVRAGPWTPEAAVEHPDAVRGLHREFLRAGADVMQAFTFYASDDKLANRGQTLQHTGSEINEAACRLAREVADEGDALVAGGISQTPSYLSGCGKDAVQKEFKKQVDVFVRNKCDFLICEYFEHIEEMEWAVEVCAGTGLPVAATMCIGLQGDLHGTSIGQCAVRMARAGASVVGLNCHFDPFSMLDAIAAMKESLDAAGLRPFLMSQPLAFHAPDAGKQGFIDLPEFPFALEPRVCTRWDMQRYARRAYELGVRYIGGCCGFESYHIRAVSEELEAERGGRRAASSEKHAPWGEGLKLHTKPWVRARARKSYWTDLEPSTGRPYSAALSRPNNWGVTQGSEELRQQRDSTTHAQMEHVFAKSGQKNN